MFILILLVCFLVVFRIQNLYNWKSKFFLVFLVACAGWVNMETFLMHTESTRKRFHHCLRQGWKNFQEFCLTFQVSIVSRWTSKRMLSQCGMNFMADLVNAEQIYSQTESTRKWFHHCMSQHGTDVIADWVNGEIKIIHFLDTTSKD